MATIVDALVVTLGLDAAAFKRGKAEASQATKKLTAEELAAAKKIEANNKIAAESFKRVRTEVLALVGLFTAGLGLTAFTVNTIKTAAALDRMSNNLGMSARDLASWQLAARNAGSSAEGITAALAESQNEIARMRFTGPSEGMQWFFRLGGKTEDLKDGNTYLLARSRIIANMFKVDPGRARFIAQQMGISDDAFNLLKQGPEAVQRYRDQQAALADEMARAAAPAEALRKQFDLLETKLQSVAVAVLTELMPVFQQWVQQLDGIAKWVVDHRDDIRNWVHDAVTEVEKFAKIADNAAEAIGGWQNVLLGLLGLKILSIVAPLARLGAALTGIGGGLAAVTNSGPAALAVLGRVIGVAELIFHSDNLNENEQRTTQPGDKWDGDPKGQQRKNGIGKDPKAAAAVDRLMQMGWTREQASGLVANFWQESLLDPTAVGDGGRAYGIGQWHSDRQEAFKNLFGIDIRKSTLDQQLQFANYELRNGKEQAAGRALLAAASAQDAGGIVSRLYERPADPREEYTRGSYASDLNNALSRANAAQIATRTSTATAPAPSNSVSTSTSSSETNINGPINVYSQATDAAGIARDIGRDLKRYNFTVAQANTGSF
ncbi:phage tail tip lysozyme [Burkholderia glumae]|uniref:phage tail tip lysozyme n=1 Tax=Burkholderia glumae TaxID=337 RepID=UPI0021640350|nr:phage tail tip lysozyme [Burkholderia glumae]UVS95646.1 hypothetical protein EFP19_07605 [Burkholderia glumae]